MEAKSLIEVTAPSNLEEGYVLQATVNDQVVDVVVPKGGVKEGEKFKVKGQTVAADQNRSDTLVIPTGQWRDGVCGCCKYGCIHPMLCNSWCFPLVAIGQVMTRLRLNFIGSPGDSRRTYITTVIMTIFTFVTSTLLLCATMYINHQFGFTRFWPYSKPVVLLQIVLHQARHLPALIQLYFGIWYYPVVLINIICFTYALVIGVRTRNYIRNKYKIPSSCGVCSDFCCIFFCNCCAVSQMGRHTTDYDSYPAACCSKTGLRRDEVYLDDLGSAKEGEKLV